MSAGEGEVAPVEMIFPAGARMTARVKRALNSAG